MTAGQLVTKSLEYLSFFTPWLIVMFSLAFVTKLIDFIYQAIGNYRNRRY